LTRLSVLFIQPGALQGEAITFSCGLMASAAFTVGSTVSRWARSRSAAAAGRSAPGGMSSKL
jgi:hypothetical protein